MVGARPQYMATLVTLTGSMPLEDLKVLVGIARVIRTRSIPTDA